MNLQKLFEAQAELDAFIEQQHPTQEGENRLEKKFLTLLVELGECANEWRGFKFWSNRQTPNELEWINEDCKSCKGTGVDVEGVALGNPYPCIECQGESFVAYAKNPLLEEYVDCLHFILSIGNDIKVSNVHVTSYSSSSPEFTQNEITIQFALIYNVTTELMFSQKEFAELNYRVLLAHFELLGRMLCFSAEQIEEAYWKKYEINKQRQRDGY